MIRKFTALALVFLLLGLQQELLVHPLTHMGSLQRGDASLQAPAADTPCVECALLAGATSTAFGSAWAPPCVAAADDCSAFDTPSRFATAPSYYQSRAPPLAL